MTETRICCQQGRLYASEQTVSRGAELTKEGVRELVDRLRDTSWWEQNVPMVEYVEVFMAPRNGRGSVGGWFPDEACGVLEMHPDHLCELYVCHELAHVLAKAQWESNAHDPMFARMYLIIVSLLLGPEMYKALYDAFVRDGIDFA